MTSIAAACTTYERRTYIRFMICAVTAILVLVLYRNPVDDILAIAVRNSEHSYIFLVPLLAVYLAWLRRSRFRLIGKRMAARSVFRATTTTTTVLRKLASAIRRMRWRWW